MMGDERKTFAVAVSDREQVAQEIESIGSDGRANSPSRRCCVQNRLKGEWLNAGAADTRAHAMIHHGHD